MARNTKEAYITRTVYQTGYRTPWGKADESIWQADEKKEVRRKAVKRTAKGWPYRA